MKQVFKKNFVFRVMLVNVALCFLPGFVSTKVLAENPVEHGIQTPLNVPNMQPAKPVIARLNFYQPQANPDRATDLGKIKLLKQLASNTQDNDPEKADTLWRLGELSAHQGDGYVFEAHALDEPIFKANENPQKYSRVLKKLRAQREKFLNQSIAWYQEAIAYLSQAANRDEYRNFKERDQVLFALGNLLRQNQREAEAQPYYQRLVSEYTTSALSAETYFHLAEYAFDKGDLSKASELYDKIVRGQPLPYQGYVLYKKGWVHYQLGQFQLSQRTFTDAISWLIEESQHSQKKWLAGLLKEARFGLVRAYAPAGDPNRAWDLFHRVGDAEADTMAEKLASQYADTGRFVESIRMYQILIEKKPTSESVCLWRAGIVQSSLSYNGGQANEDSSQKIQELLTSYNYTKLHGDWQPEVVAACTNRTRAFLVSAAKGWHIEGARAKDQADSLKAYRLAIPVYQAYIKWFGKESNLDEMQFYYAELLQEVGSANNGPSQGFFCQAANSYDELVQKNPQRKNAENIAYGAVFNWNKCLSEKQEQQPESKVWLPEHQRFLEACEQYIALNPTGKQVVEVTYQKGRLLYDFNRMEQAIPVFRALVRTHPQNDLAIPAAQLLLDALAFQINQNENQADDKLLELLQEVEKLKQTTLGQQADFAKQLLQIKLRALRKQAEQMAKKGLYQESAVQYVALANAYATDPTAPELWYNAAAYFEKAHLLEKSVEAREALSRNHENHPITHKSMLLLGDLYMRLAAYDKAADSYETFAIHYIDANAPDDKERAHALVTAAALRRKLGHATQALADTTNFIKYFPDLATQAAELMFAMIDVYEQNDNKEALKEHIKLYLSTWAEKGGPIRNTLAHLKLAAILWQQSCPVKEANGLCITSKVVSPNKNMCAVRSLPSYFVYSRDPKLVNEATAQFQLANEKFKTEKTDAAEIPSVLTEALASAKAIEVDQKYERFLQTTAISSMPKKLHAWWDQTLQTATELKKEYEAVTQTKTSWSFVALARLGQLYKEVSDALYRIPIPPAPKAKKGITQEEWATNFRDSYCEQTSQMVSPVEKKATELLETCLKISTQNHIQNEWSFLCEQMLQETPGTYPFLYADWVPDFSSLAKFAVFAKMGTEDVEKKTRELLGANPQSMAVHEFLIQLHLVKAEQDIRFLKKAQMLTDAAIQINPEHAPLFYLQGLIRQKRGQKTGAMADFQRSLRLDPKLAEVHMALAMLLLQNRDYASAEMHFRSAASEIPQAWMGLGAALHRQDLSEQAESAYQQAQQQPGLSCAAFYNLGILYQDDFAFKKEEPAEKTKFYQQAKEYLTRFLNCSSDARFQLSEAKTRVEQIEQAMVALSESTQVSK